MLIKPIPVREFYGSEDTRDNVRRAAHYAGHAGAMVTNLHAAGSPERAEVWQAEHDAWLQRKDELIAEAPLGRPWLASYAAETVISSYEASAVTL